MFHVKHGALVHTHSHTEQTASRADVWLQHRWRSLNDQSVRLANEVSAALFAHNQYQTKSVPRTDLFHVEHSMPGASNGHLLDVREQRRGHLIRLINASAAFASLAML
ncbi:MAG: hypothetical protein EAZ21_09940 [Betaproteobacteria bacterium]|nr:MAG: hypothetical protein EAZ21_09940 [Betaproteobacteria bacterium]